MLIGFSLHVRPLEAKWFTEERIAAIKKLEFSTTLTDLETFTGICNYHRGHTTHGACRASSL
jgi:hypothetical protein